MQAIFLREKILLEETIKGFSDVERDHQRIPEQRTKYEWHKQMITSKFRLTKTIPVTKKEICLFQGKLGVLW